MNPPTPSPTPFLPVGLRVLAAGLATGLGLTSLSLVAGDWPQFRGPQGRAVAEGPPPPSQFGADTHCLWQQPCPAGLSSPVLQGDRLYLTAVEDGRLATLAWDRATGRRRWTQNIPAPRLEPTHRLGSPAAPTPCSDASSVYAYFGSYGVVAYDHEGKERWRHPLPAPVVEFGTSASPMLAGGSLIVVVDQDQNSFLLALNPRDGSEVWRTPRPEFRRSFATPFLWEHPAGPDLVVPGSVALTSYDPATGRERWRYVGTSRVATSSPTSGDGWLFSSSWNLGGDGGSRVTMPPAATFFAEHDGNHDEYLVRSEIPVGPVADRFTQMDFNKDGRVTPAEWDAMAEMFARAENAVLAIRPGGTGTLPASQLAWKSTRSLPYVSSPVWHRGRLFTVKNGGLASLYEGATGKVLYQDERLGAGGDYYASTVACGDRLYVTSQEGVVTVVRLADRLEVLARNPLGSQTLATPALADGVLYVRTQDRLFAFGPGK